jgi:hypothetical protein
MTVAVSHVPDTYFKVSDSNFDEYSLLSETSVQLLGLPRACLQELTYSPLIIMFSFHSMVYNYDSRNTVGKQPNNQYR